MRSAVFYPAKERRMARCDFWQIFASSINACDANRIRSQTSKTCCWNLTVSSGQRRSTSTWSATMCYFPQARANYVQSCCSGANTSTTDYQWACHAPPMSSRRKSTSSSTDSNERIHAYLDDAVLLTTKARGKITSNELWFKNLHDFWPELVCELFFVNLGVTKTHVEFCLSSNQFRYSFASSTSIS